MATINQLVRKPRKRQVAEKRRSCSAGMSAAPRCLHSGLHHYPKEAELGSAEGMSCTPDEWF